MKQMIHIGIIVLIALVVLAFWLFMPEPAVSPDELVSFPLQPLAVQAMDDAQESLVRMDDPVRLAIPSIGLDSNVRSALAIGNQWQFFPDAASHWKDSSAPGEGGNIVLYAHREGLFGNLYEVKIGDSVIVGTQSGSFRYTISSFRIVSPEQLEVFAPTDEEQLTLLTCTNPDDADRLVIIARPSSSFGELL